MNLDAMSRRKPDEERSNNEPAAHGVSATASGLYEATKAHVSSLGIAAVAAFVGMTAPVAAQETAGSGICGTPLADTINQAAPLVIGLLMIGGAMLSYILHNAAGLVKDPERVAAIKDWRNRAAFTSITTPLFALVMQLFIGFTGVSLASCVDLVPFV